MKLRLPVRTIRARLTLWHLGVTVATLLLFMAMGQVFLWNQLTRELKATLYDDVEVIEHFLSADPDGDLLWAGHDRIATADRLIDVRHPDGRLIYQNAVETKYFSTLKPATREIHGATFHSFRLPKRGGVPYLVIQEFHQVDGIPFLIQVGRSKVRHQEEMIHLLLAQGLCFPFVILLAWGSGYFLAGRALSPVRKIMDHVKHITVDHLHERLPVESPEDELGQLSLTFNALLSKLDHSFTRMQQFTADASHELRTPLAALRSVGEIALRAPMNAEEYQETVASMLEEVEKMSRLVHDLLALARSDSGHVQISAEFVDLGDLLKEVMALLGVLAEEKEQRIVLEIEHPCRARIDRKIFRHALVNVLHNAIKFTPEGKGIHLQAGSSEGGVFIEVWDSGPGIDKEHHEKVFDRFYRVDKGRSRDTGGSGLGLAIARWAVEIHGGTIKVKSEPGQGCRFQIFLPAS